MKVNKLRRVLGLSAFMALLQPAGLQAALPQSSNGNSPDFVAFNVNDASLHHDLYGNGQDLRKITEDLDKVFADPQTRLHRIVITGYASPDGSFSANAKLAQQRTISLKDYLSSRYSLSEDMIVTRSVAEDWDGLEKFVTDASLQQLPNRDAVLQIVRSDRKADAKEQAIRKQFPQDFQYLKDYCLPQLRRSEYKVELADNANANTNTNLSSDDLLKASEGDAKTSVTAENTASEDGSTVATASAVSYDNTTASESTPRYMPASLTLTGNVSHGFYQVVSDRSEAASESVDDRGNYAVADEALNDTIRGYSQIVPSDKIVVSEKTLHDSINGDAQVRFIINEYNLRPDYRGNETDLDKITSSLDKMLANEHVKLQRIIIHGYASPDGSYRFNQRLAYNRANTLRSLVLKRYQWPDGFVKVESTPEDWEGLEKLVLQTSEMDLPNKAAILDVIHSNKLPDQKERILRSYKQDFNYMKEHILPLLRRTDYYFEYIVEDREVVLKDAPKVEPEPEPEPVIVPEEPVEIVVEKKPWYLAVKTNLLYDAVVVPNIGVEVYLGKQWTVLGDWFYTWFKNDNKYRYWQGYGGYLGVRRYFGSKAQEHPFTGHHAGVYASMLTHDVEFGGRGYQMPHFGFGGGVEYGYSAPIARRLNLDFSLGIGYQGGTYHEYVPIDNHYVWQTTRKRNWFGPTKLEVSLVWLIGRGNYHK